MSFDWSLVYTVVALAVFGIGWVIAYARGYSAGHDDGFTECVAETFLRRDLRKRGDN